MNPVRSIGLGLLVGPAIAFGIMAAGSQSAHAATVAISVPSDDGHHFRDRDFGDFEEGPGTFDGGGFGDILITNSNRAEGGNASSDQTQTQNQRQKGLLVNVLDALLED